MKMVKTNVILQSDGREVNVSDLTAKAKAAFVAEGHKESEIKDVVVYMKTEENGLYYVINDTFTGKCDLF